MSTARDGFDFKDVWQNKRGVVILVGALVLLALCSGVYFLFFAGANNPDGATMTNPGAPGAPGAPSAPGAQGSGAPPVAGARPGGFPPAPGGKAGAPGAMASGAPIAASGVAPMGAPGGLPGTPGTGRPGAGAQQIAAAPVRGQDSFADAPIGYGGSATGAAAGLGGIGGTLPSTQIGMSGAVGAGGGGGAPASAKPAPILANVVATKARMDPFVPFYKFISAEPPAYSFLVADRMAKRPTPPIPEIHLTPEEKFGPLPPVERRVAGILFDGSVSAILETGTPGGADTRVDVIQPGSKVPSGVVNIEDLTVASITPNEVVLRADDGRTTTVKLSNVSAAYADAFHSATAGPTSGGGGQQGQGGTPQGQVRSRGVAGSAGI